MWFTMNNCKSSYRIRRYLTIADSPAGNKRRSPRDNRWAWWGSQGKRKKNSSQPAFFFQGKNCWFCFGHSIVWFEQIFNRKRKFWIKERILKQTNWQNNHFWINYRAIINFCFIQWKKFRVKLSFFQFNITRQF